MSPTNVDERRAALRELGDALGNVADALLDRGLQLEEALKVFEVRYVRSAVARHRGNISQAAAALGIHRNTLRSKLQRNGQRKKKGT
ncbi:MAG TPA: helix-turn-helix domain-containing protein [Thermoanaerobaculaceae bacterium]|nr:helix-turn-helix domain-containing protein [Thermoanaerobaculaceae bacterium]